MCTVFFCILALKNHIIRKHVSGHKQGLRLVMMVALQPVTSLPASLSAGLKQSLKLVCLSSFGKENIATSCFLDSWIRFVREACDSS